MWTSRWQPELMQCQPWSTTINLKVGGQQKLQGYAVIAPMGPPTVDSSKGCLFVHKGRLGKNQQPKHLSNPWEAFQK